MSGIEWEKLVWIASFEAPYSLIVSLEATSEKSNPKKKQIRLTMNTKGKSLSLSEAIQHFILRFNANQNQQTSAKHVPDANYQAMFDKFF